MNLTNRSFLKLLDYTPEEIEGLLDLAADLKAKKKAGIRHDALRGKNIALIFEKTSTRTRCSFEVAAHDLGMEVTYLDPSGSQIGKKESIADTARVLGRMFDGIEYRGYGQQHRGRPGPLRRCAGVERPDQRVPPHPDPRRLPHHPGALRPPQGHQLRLLRRRPLQHGQQPDGGLRQDGPQLHRLRPQEVPAGRCTGGSSARGHRRRDRVRPSPSRKTLPRPQRAQTSSTPTSGCPWASRSRSGPSASTTWPPIRSTRT